MSDKATSVLDLALEVACLLMSLQRAVVVKYYRLFFYVMYRVSVESNSSDEEVIVTGIKYTN